MFNKRISELNEEDIRNVIALEMAEGPDFELKREIPNNSKQTDGMKSDGTINEHGKNELTKELIAFANTAGGTIVIGIDEERSTKRASSIVPIKDCQKIADSLHQAISAKIEPRLPFFECVGIPTEADNSSGVIVLQTLSSYLAPHRHTHDRHCYTRRKDRAEPMSMSEIRDTVIQKKQANDDIDKVFAKSREDFLNFIPGNLRREHPMVGVTNEFTPIKNYTRITRYGLRVTAQPFQPIPLGHLPKKTWLATLVSSRFWELNQNFSPMVLTVEGTWRPMLGGIQKDLKFGTYGFGKNRLWSNGKFEFFGVIEFGKTANSQSIVDINEVLLVVGSGLKMADISRMQGFRPTQNYALEVEIFPSERFHLSSRANFISGVFQEEQENIILPRYELDSDLPELITSIGRDLLNYFSQDIEWAPQINWST